jgi:hypothetical protein
MAIDTCDCFASRGCSLSFRCSWFSSVTLLIAANLLDAWETHSRADPPLTFGEFFKRAVQYLKVTTSKLQTLN